ncbi:MAG TPA: alpha/beta fold hydrolase [Oscillatoriaceae cyanobacterium]
MLNPLQQPLQPVLQPDAGTAVWRGFVHVIRHAIPLDVDPTSRLLRPGVDADHRVRSLQVPIGEHTSPGHLFLPKQGNGGTVLLAHGTTAEKVLPYYFFIRALLQRGFAVMTFELDGHGDNPRPLCPGGIAENVPSALAFLREQPEIDPARIGLMGVSMGGACAINAAGRDAVKCVAAVSTPHWVSMDDWDKVLEMLGTLNPELLGSCFEATPNHMLAFLNSAMRVAPTLAHPAEEMELLHPGTIDVINRVLHQLDPLGNATQLGDTPLLVVNGEWDNITPSWQARDIYEHASGPKSCALIPRRNHFTIMTSTRAVRAVVDWFERWL